MNENIEMLNYVHQNCQMGIETLKELIDILKDEEPEDDFFNSLTSSYGQLNIKSPSNFTNFKNTLHSQYNEYCYIYENANSLLKKYNKESKDINIITKISTYLTINLKTLIDKTPSHISKMLIKGTTMGTTSIAQKINDYRNADKAVLSLARNLLDFEKNNLTELEKFL